MIWFRFLTIGGIGLIGGLWGWREFNWYTREAHWVNQKAQATQAREKLRQENAELKEGLEAEKKSREVYQQAQNEQAALEENLRTQIEVLQEHRQQCQARIKELNKTLQQKTNALRASRKQLIATKKAPSKDLRKQRKKDRLRIEQLSRQLDEAAQIRHLLPPRLTLVEKSDNGRAIALQKAPESPGWKNQPVFICRNNEVIARGTIQEEIQDHWICLLESKFQPLSALVIGEKLFIVRIRNEANDT